MPCRALLPAVLLLNACAPTHAGESRARIGDARSLAVGATGAEFVCRDAATTVAMHACLTRELEVAEAALRTALDSLRQRGAPPDLVHAADSAWHRFVAYDCALAGARFAGGSMERLETATCRLRMLRARADAVTRAYRDPSRRSNRTPGANGA